MKDPETTITLSPALMKAIENARAAREASEDYNAMLRRRSKPGLTQEEFAHSVTLMSRVNETTHYATRLFEQEILFPSPSLKK